ncbi:lytic transglycosylase domain-containing protein [Ruminococcaceae bacterium OttesenSCG-928-A16]|nr:lytic transglycosylase domain-containing protein [Ruminococcaceae bacterium OttesenSCG-928-A16]
MHQKKASRRRVIVSICLLLALGLILLAGPVIEGIKKQNYPLEYTELVEQYAAEYSLDPYLVYAFIRTESGFNPKAQSSAGARGLMQMTDETFEWLKQKIAPDEPLTFEDLFLPNVSIRFGSYFLSLCIARYNGDISTAAAAYHSGWGTVDRLLEEGEHTQNGIHLTTFPYEQMNNYVRKINKNYQKYLALYTAGTAA